jgi:glycosyltransferase involved in cell wall biosynthesis
MRIVLVAHNLRIAGGLSVGQSILRTLPEIAPIHDYLIFVPSGCGYPDYSNRKNVQLIECPSRGIVSRFFWEWFLLTRIISSFHPGWIWCLGNYGLTHPGCRQSILFHDSHLIYPASKFGDVGCWYLFKKWLLNRKLRASLAYTSTVYCQTDTVRQKFHESFNYSLDRIAMCPGAFSLPEPSQELPEMLKPQNLPSEKFKLFYVSSCSGHKNHRILLDLFDNYREELSDVVCFLTIDPHGNERAASIGQGIRDRSLENHLVPIGHIEASQVARCYGEMDALIFPSLLETVGLPLIEAMQFELPIIVSNLDFAHEICGPAAEYVDPTSVESIKDGILKLRHNAVRCSELIQLGKERINSHIKNWPDILRDVLDHEKIEHL